MPPWAHPPSIRGFLSDEQAMFRRGELVWFRGTAAVVKSVFLDKEGNFYDILCGDRIVNVEEGSLSKEPPLAVRERSRLHRYRGDM